MIDHCPETRRRIRLSVAAWAYEIHDDPVMSDADFDALSRQVDLSISTARPDLDEWFRAAFDPNTGVWVHGHPEAGRLEALYRSLRPSGRMTLTAWVVLP